MLKNIGKLAWRNLVRHKTFSAINILGLALGLAASLFIFLWVKDEWSIGRQYAHGDRLYRVMEREFTAGKVVADEDTPGILAEELKKVFPQVEYAAGFTWYETHLLSAGEKAVRQDGCYAGADWFRMYNIPLLAGTPATALEGLSSLAISRRVAEALFGDVQSAMGKTIRFDHGDGLKVTAVFENLPAGDPERYDFLRNWPLFLQYQPWAKDWTNAGPGTRLQLKADADPVQFEAKLKHFLKGRNTDFGPTFYIEYFLQPETDAYLYAQFRNGYREGGRIVYVRLLSMVAVFLLLIAGINFTNLATARSVKRAREVGVRKVVGAGRGWLIGQFIGEALLLTALAMIVAVVLGMALLPAFNQLTGKALTLSLDKPSIWALLLGLLVLMACIAGGYPAFFLSGLQPVRVLKGTLRFGAGSLLFRRGLVVFQFTMSMLLITGTLIVYRQLHYIQTKDLGYDRKNLISIQGEGAVSKQYETFRQELLHMPGIQSVSFAELNPLYNGNTTESVSWPGKDPQQAISFNQTSVGYDFAEVLKVKILRGRDFSPAFAADSSNYLINEAAARKIGVKDPVGMAFTFWDAPGTIIGVVEDFHFNSLHTSITPMIIRLQKKVGGSKIYIRAKTGQTRQAIASLSTLFHKMNPAFPFAYSFVEEGYRRQYIGETIVSKLATVFTFLAIFIACLGLFGLAAFTAEQRTKEIGVRKVLGASVGSIVRLLSRDFMKLVLVAIVVATPLAWWVMHEWLQSFHYRIAINGWIFALAGLLALLIALVTVSFQSIKAARMNPARSLKTE